MDMDLKAFAKVNFNLDIIMQYSSTQNITFLNVFQDIRILDKETKNWDLYIGLDNSVKDIMTALRSVNDLQNSAIRDRHWEEVRIVTGVNIFMKLFYLFKNFR